MFIDASGTVKSLDKITYVTHGTPLLNRFRLQYRKRDAHKVLKLFVWSDAPAVGGTPNTALVGFGDEDNDRLVDYSIAHWDFDASARYSGWPGSDRICSDRGGCSYRLNRPAADSVFVIGWFSVQFHGDAHKLKSLKIRENDGVLSVNFNDDDQDKISIWDLWYTYLPSDAVSLMGTASKGSSNPSPLSQQLPGRIAVIRGFDLTFAFDEKVGLISVGVDNGVATAEISDEEHDKDFTAEVDWAILSPSTNLLSFGDAGTPGNVSNPVVVGSRGWLDFDGGWLDFTFLFAGRNVLREDRIYAVDQNGRLLSYGDAGTPGNVSNPMVVGFGGWLDFKFLFAGRNVLGEDRIYAVDQNDRLLSYGDAGTPGNVSNPMVVGFGGWLDFKFLFAGRNVLGEDRIYAVDQNGRLLSYGDAGTPGNVSNPMVVGFGGWLDFKFLFAGRNVLCEDRIYAVGA